MSPVHEATSGSTHDHGGHLAAFRRRFPGAPEPTLDLSTGINPVSYELPALGRLDWTRLPEPEAVAELETAAAQAYRVRDPALVVAGPGTQLLINMLPLLAPRRRVAILSPTYGEHAIAWRRAGCEIVETPSLGDLSAADLAVVGQPNNPDGRIHAPAELLALADHLAARDGLLVVDEAFADFHPEASLAPALPHPALLIWRSFGKAYGLAGLRLGFALAAPPWAARLRQALGPWAVSGPAVAIAPAALRDHAWRAQASLRLERDTARLDRLLAPYGEVTGSLLFRTVRSTASESLQTRLGAAGIAVRRFHAMPHWLRFGLPGDEEGWSRLTRALSGADA